MDVEGSDQRGPRRAAGVHHQLRDKPPGPEPSTHFLVPIPLDWPEVRAYRAGWRLAEAEEDTVPTLLRLGSDITGYLNPYEVEAMLALDSGTFERWLRLGWRAWELDNEGR